MANRRPVQSDAIGFVPSTQDTLDGSNKVDEDFSFWQGLAPVSLKGPVAEKDTRSFISIRNEVEKMFPCAENLEKVLKFEKRCFKINNEEDPVTLTLFRHMTKCFGPYKRTEKSCIHLEQVNKLVSYTVPQDGARLSPFAGWMTQDEAEEVLRDKKAETYLVRFSEGRMEQGGFSLAVKVADGGIRHYRIEGHLDNAVKGDQYDARLQLVHGSRVQEEQEFKDIVDFMSRRLDDEIEDGVYCTSVCPGLPFNALMRGYN